MADIDTWKDKVHSAPDEELTALLDADYLGLWYAEGEYWLAYIRIVEEELTRRGLKH